MAVDASLKKKLEIAEFQVMSAQVVLKVARENLLSAQEHLEMLKLEIGRSVSEAPADTRTLLNG
jgi:uncharacterized protein YggL (DUF469 family)